MTLTAPLRENARVQDQPHNRAFAIAERIDARLKAVGLSERAAALKAGLNADAIRNIRRGREPRAITLEALAKVLGCTLSDLTGDQAAGPMAPYLLTDAAPVRPNVAGMAEAPDALSGWPKDVPVYGTAAAGHEWDDVFQLNMGDVVDYVRRPPRLVGVPKIFSVLIAGQSMVPRYADRAPVFVHSGVLPRPGEDALVELHPSEEGGPHPGLVKRLVSRTDQRLRLEQFNPPDSNIVIPMKRVLRLSRVVPYEELFF